MGRRRGKVGGEKGRVEGGTYVRVGGGERGEANWGWGRGGGGNCMMTQKLD